MKREAIVALLCFPSPILCFHGLVLFFFFPLFWCLPVESCARWTQDINISWVLMDMRSFERWVHKALSHLLHGAYDPCGLWSSHGLLRMLKATETCIEGDCQALRPGSWRGWFTEDDGGVKRKLSFRSPKARGEPLLMKSLGWPYEPFHVPEDVKKHRSPHSLPVLVVIIPRQIWAVSQWNWKGNYLWKSLWFM